MQQRKVNQRPGNPSLQGFPDWQGWRGHRGPQGRGGARGPQASPGQVLAHLLPMGTGLAACHRPGPGVREGDQSHSGGAVAAEPSPDGDQVGTQAAAQGPGLLVARTFLFLRISKSGSTKLGK